MTTRLLLIIFLIAAVMPAVAQLPPPFPYPEPAPENVITHTHGNVELGWYASSDVYKYLADINVSFDFGAWHDAHFNFGGGILTLVKSTSEDGFQPDRYRGTIEPSIYLPKGNNVYIFSVRHQSFHAIDRPRETKESYELYNVAYQRPRPPNLRLAVGKYAHRTGVDYSWDVLGQIDNACLGHCSTGRIYGSATGRFVKANGSLSDRDSFLDYSLEAGIQTKSGIRYFASYRRIHDIDGFSGATDNGVILGMKFLW